MARHLLVAGHVWPGLTWEVVWRLPYDVWCLYADGAERWSRQQAKDTREAQQTPRKR